MTEGPLMTKGRLAELAQAMNDYFDTAEACGATPPEAMAALLHAAAELSIAQGSTKQVFLTEAKLAYAGRVRARCARPARREASS